MAQCEKTAIISDLKNKLFASGSSPSPSGRTTPTPSTRGAKSTQQLLTPSDHNSRLKPHHRPKRVQEPTQQKAASSSRHNQRYENSPAKEPELLCIFGCCGRGKLLIMWMDPDAEYRSQSSRIHKVSTPSDSTNPHNNGSTQQHQQQQPQQQQQQSSSNSHGIVSSLSHHLLMEFGSSSNQNDHSPGTSPDLPPPSLIPTNPKERLGLIQFSLRYDYQSSILTLKIIKAVDLVAKDFTGTSDPYVKVMLLPDKKNKLTTNIKRRNLNPKWNEVFAFEGYPHNKLMSRTMYMQVLDYDRFSRDDPIGEVCLPLGDLDLSKEQTMWMPLQPCKSHMGKLGELLVTLCYQPSAETVTIIINEARGLKAKDINGLSDPYVKIWLTRDGKKIEKRKTVIQEKCLNPVYNETFMFCIPYEFIRQTTLAVSVMDYDRMGRNELIGQITLGSKSGPLETKHWNEMFQKSRQQVSQWHILKEFG